MAKKIICTIPQRLCTRAVIQATERSLVAVYQRHVKTQKPPLILWCALPEGQSYVAGKADEVFIAMAEVDNGFDQTVREALMLGIADCFAKAFDISTEKPLVSALDSSIVNAYLTANRKRLVWHQRPVFLFTTLLHIVRSKQQQGFAALRANLASADQHKMD